MELKRKVIILIDAVVIILAILATLFSNSVTEVISYLKNDKILAEGDSLSFNLIASPEEARVKAGDTVTIMLSVADINVGQTGLNNIVGNLVYDEQLFDSMTIEGIEDWNIELNQVQNHALYGKFCIYAQKEGITENQDVVKMTLKLKSDLKPQETEVKFLNLKSSEGNTSIDEQDRKVKIIIYEDVIPEPEITPTPEPTPEEPQPEKVKVKTGDTLVGIATLVIALVLVANILIFMKNKKAKIVLSIVIIVIGIAIFGVTTFAENETLEQLMQRLSVNESWLNSEEYLVTDTDISRIEPATTVETLKNEFNKSVVVKKSNEEVTTGLVETGMTVQVADEAAPYTISVFGDLNKDGYSDHVDLTTIIRNVVNAEDWSLNGARLKSADMKLDGTIDNKDINASIRNIVYGELQIPDFEQVAAPTIAVTGGTLNEQTGAYEDTITLTITQNEQNAQKTMYKIEGSSNEIVYTQIEDGGTITLPNDGVYKISAYTYGQLGNRSLISTKIVTKKISAVTLTIHHYEQGTTTKVAEDETIVGQVNDAYITTSLIAENNKLSLAGTELTGTRNYLNSNKYSYVSVSGQETGTLQKGITDVIYYYNVNRYTISAEIMSENGQYAELKDMPVVLEYGENQVDSTKIKMENREYGIECIKLYTGENASNNHDISGGLELTNYEYSRQDMIYTLTKFTNVTENKHLVVKIKPLSIVAQIVAVPNGSEEMQNEYGETILNHVYYRLEDAIYDAQIANENEGFVEIKILGNIQNESNVLEDGNNVILDLNGFTINSDRIRATIDIQEATLLVKDKSAIGTGKIVNTKSIAVNVSILGSLTLGENDGAVSITTPTVQGKTYGVYKEIDEETGDQSTFNFYDGKIIGQIAVNGTVDDTPLLWDATNVSSEGNQISTLAIAADAEAAIGKKTYIRLEDAIADVGILYGADNSQVEIDVVKNITKEQTVEIASNKNIKLDLNGFTISSIGSDYIFTNKGKLEVIDSSANAEHVNGLGKITGANGNTIFNDVDAELKLTNGTIDISKNGNPGRYTAVENKGDFTISGGKLLGNANFNTGIINYAQATVTVNGGKIGSEQPEATKVNLRYSPFVAITNNALATVTVGAGANIENAINSEGTIEVTGGTINKISNDKAGVVTINGGTITNVENCHDATNKMIVKNAQVSVTNESESAQVECENITGSISNTYKGGFTCKNSDLTRINNTGAATIVLQNVTTVTTNLSTGSIDATEFVTGSMYITSPNAPNITLTNVTVLESGFEIYVAGGTITLNNVTSGSEIINKGTSVVNINDGAITSSTNGITNEIGGVINIAEGTTIESTSTDANAYAIVNNTGTINIGTKNTAEITNVNTTTPSIKGANGGIYIADGVCNYYDGKITALPTKAIVGMVTEIENKNSDGEYLDIVSTINANSMEEVILGIPTRIVAMIDTTEYASLQKAIDSCDNTQGPTGVATEIKIVDSIDNTRIITISQGQNIKLNLNSQTISSNINAIENNGTLEITNIKAEPTSIVGTIKAKSGSLIKNKTGANLKITDGILQINQDKLIANEGTLNVVGGQLSILGEQDYSNNIIYNDLAGSATISAETLTGNICNNSTGDISLSGVNLTGGIRNQDFGEITIENGTAITEYVTNNGTGDISIQNSTISGGLINSEEADVTITNSSVKAVANNGAGTVTIDGTTTISERS